MVNFKTSIKKSNHRRLIKQFQNHLLFKLERCMQIHLSWKYIWKIPYLYFSGLLAFRRYLGIFQKKKSPPEFQIYLGFSRKEEQEPAFQALRALPLPSSHFWIWVTYRVSRLLLSISTVFHQFQECFPPLTFPVLFAFFCTQCAKFPPTHTHIHLDLFCCAITLILFGLLDLQKCPLQLVLQAFLVFAVDSTCRHEFLSWKGACRSSLYFLPRN